MPAYQATYSMPAAAGHPPQFQSRNYEHFRVTPNSGALGADVEGIDLRQAGDTAFAEIEQALADHLVLFIRGQDLEPKAQIAFAERLGPLMQYRYVEPMPGYPHLSELLTEPGDVYNFGGTWHSDTPQIERPPMYTMLYAVECPPVGGDTSYANQYMAWDTLSADMRRMLDTLHTVHSAALSFGGHYGSEEVQGKSTTQSAYAADLKIETAHPVGHPSRDRAQGALRLQLLCRPFRRHEPGGEPAAAALPVGPLDPARFHLPLPLAARHAGHLGQPQLPALRAQRLSRPAPPHAPHRHRGRAAVLTAKARKNARTNRIERRRGRPHAGSVPTQQSEATP